MITADTFSNWNGANPKEESPPKPPARQPSPTPLMDFVEAAADAVGGDKGDGQG